MFQEKDLPKLEHLTLNKTSSVCYQIDSSIKKVYLTKEDEESNESKQMLQKKLMRQVEKEKCLV